MPLPISRLAASRHGARLVGQVDESWRELLAEETKDAIESLYGIGITVHPADTPMRGGCGVHGIYSPTNPPTIEINRSSSGRRDRFTMLHELGHHLIRLDAALIDDLYDLDAGPKARSIELVADAVAGRLLITDTEVDDAVADGVTAASVVQLFENTHASREACAVRAADLLDQPGAVMVGFDNVAVFTAHHGTPWHVARSVPQSDKSILNRAVGGGRATGTTTVRFANDRSSTEMYADAKACDDGWVFAVLTLTRPAAKGSFSAPLGGFIDNDAIECHVCDSSFRPYGQPCVCGEFECPNGHCGCDKGPPTRRCDMCFLHKAVNLFDGADTVCADCS